MDVYEFAELMESLTPAVEKASFDEEKDQVADEAREIQAENFKGEQDKQGTPWLPRNADYQHPPLRKTRKMHDAATTSGAPGAITRKDSDGVTIEIDDGEVPYAKWQQRGTKDGRVPARPYFYIRFEHLPRIAKPLYPALRRLFFETARRIVK